MLVKLLLDIMTLCIPIPDELNRLYRTSKGLLTDLCQLCYQMVDLVGFFRWVACVFKRELVNWIDVVIKTLKWLHKNFTGKSIGYLIHLDAHRKEFGFHLCIDEGVPFYYPWLDAYTTMPWLH